VHDPVSDRVDKLLFSFITSPESFFLSTLSDKTRRNVLGFFANLTPSNLSNFRKYVSGKGVALQPRFSTKFSAEVTIRRMQSSKSELK